MSCVSISGKQHVCVGLHRSGAKETTYKQTTQLLPGMVVMLRQSEISYPISHSWDVDTRGDKRHTQGQAETQKEGLVDGQVYRQRDREKTVMTG